MASRLDIVSTPFATNLINRKARQLCARPGFSRSDEADLRQSMLLYLWSASRLFDAARGNAEAFIVTVLRSWTDMEVRSRRAQKRYNGAAVVSLDTTKVEGRDGSHELLGERIADSELFHRTRTMGLGTLDVVQNQDLFARVKSTLSASDLQFVHEVATRGMADVARTERVSRRQVASRLHTIRDQFSTLRAASHRTA